MPPFAVRLLLMGVLFTPAVAAAQYAEVPRLLPTPVNTAFGGGLSSLRSAVQIGRRLFVAGEFSTLSDPSGSAVVLDPAGRIVPGAFPQFLGLVHEIVPDPAGGWFVAGERGSVDGRPHGGLVRVAANRTVDPRFQVSADGLIRRVAVAHGRVYIAGDFTTVNGTPRRGLAALDAGGGLSAWSAGFDPGAAVTQLSVSSLGVYVASGPASPAKVWGLHAQTGQVLFSRSMLVTALAASSARVYIGGVNPLPVRALDPFTGQDAAWGVNAVFEYLPGAYGVDGTIVSALLLDGPRLYMAGRFRTSGREGLGAIDLGSGSLAAWRPASIGVNGDPTARLSRVGPAVAVSLGGIVPTLGGTNRLLAYDVTTAATLAFQSEITGALVTAAPAPEGVVVGGAFGRAGGLARPGLASIDLDTMAVEPWIPALPASPLPLPMTLGTDGTSLFALYGRDFSAPDPRLLKIDPVSGAILADRTVPSLQTTMRVAGAHIVLTTSSVNTAATVGLVTIADWSYQALPVTIDGTVASVDVAGDTMYLAGTFGTVNGQPRHNLAAVHRLTGALLGWDPQSDLRAAVVRATLGRVFVAGEFGTIGGVRRRGLAELDPVTGAARPWNPHVDSPNLGNVVALEIGADGSLYASTGTPFADSTWVSYAAGQVAPSTLAYSLATGRRLPWRTTQPGLWALTPDCLLVELGCLPPAVAAPDGLQVAQSGASIALSWTLPPAPARTGVRLEFGRAEGSADLATLDLPADQTSFSATAPPGRYVARVRALAGSATSRTTADVSFAVGPPAVPAAPLDLTAVTNGPAVTFAWAPPSTGAPAAYVLEAGSEAGRSDIGGITLPGGATSFAIDVPAGVYWARIAALNAAGRSAPSRDVRIDTRPRYGCTTSQPPRSLTATVVGRVVTFTWQPSQVCPDQFVQLVVGSAPGLRDLAAVDMPAYATAFAVTAPPGRYYVRARANCFGVCDSNEVRVDVP